MFVCLFEQKKFLEGVTSDLKEAIQSALKLPNIGRGICLEHKTFNLRKKRKRKVKVEFSGKECELQWGCRCRSWSVSCPLEEAGKSN